MELKSSDPLVLVLALDRLASRMQLRKDFEQAIKNLTYRSTSAAVTEGLQSLRSNPTQTLLQAAHGDQNLANKLSYHRNRLGIGRLAL